MADIEREKVIKGLELCQVKPPDTRRCEECPYQGVDPRCIDELHRNAFSLLKEQEAEWIYGEDETGADGWHCSYCGFFEPWFYEFTDDIDFIKFYSFCPSCGRRMTSYTGKPTQEGR